jgi:hypothetical protein
VNVVCCHMEVSTTDRSLVQKSPMDVRREFCVLSEISATGRSLVQRSPMDVCRDFCLLSSKDLCDGLIRRSEESYG